MQLIVAGKSHPADDGGKALIQQIVRFADRPEVRHRIAFLPDYDMSMARFLYWGCDVWLNNPLRPLEACGTSGMKSALNGGLNLSIRDGWWDEWYDGENGWEIPTADGLADESRRDDLEAVGALRPAGEVGDARSSTTATSTACRGAGWRWCGTRCRCSGPRCWRRGWCATTPRSTTRPRRSRCTARSRPVDGVPFGAARDLAALLRAGAEALAEDPDHRRRQLRTARHPAARLGADVDRDGAARRAAARRGGGAGGRRPGRRGDALVDPVTVPMTHTGCRRTATRSSRRTTPLPVAGPVGYTVRVLPHHRLLAADNELGLVTLA